MINQEKLKEYQERLEREKKELLDNISRHQTTEDFGADTDHFEEETDEAEAFSTNLALIQEYKNHLAEIETALMRIQDNKYGACEKCHQEIAEAVLDIEPESRFCQECKKQV